MTDCMIRRILIHAAIGTTLGTVGQVEIDPYCNQILTRHWPEVPRHDDVRTACEWWQSETRVRCGMGNFSRSHRAHRTPAHDRDQACRMNAADLDRHTHQGHTVTGTDTTGRRRVIRVHNIIREDGLVFVCHEKHAAYPFEPEQEVEVLR